MKREVKIGIFAAVVLLCLYLGVNYLKGKDVFSGDRVYYTMLEQTGGLQTSAPVLLKGVKIGSVTGITIDPAHTDQVVVTVNIKKSFRIPTDSSLKMFTNGIMGGKAIEFVPGVADTYFERGAVIPSIAESGLLDVASTSIEDVIDEFKRLVNSLDATSVTINSVLQQNAESFKGTMDNINSTTRQLSEAGVGDMIAELGAFTHSLQQNAGRLDSIMANLDTVSGSLAGTDLGGTVAGLDESIASLNRVLADIESGEGTVGRLLDDPAMYDSLTSAAGSLNMLLEDLRANPKRYVHFSLFGGGKDKKK
ncbi:MAG: MlaD family protein [Rikenellaceae bacterium]|jgi:phospholipid/cholesterol/gamma-HCH transport system substrate-binding protein|nr:MlaD family protein [Rikenellaceae bacterium]